MILVSGGRAKQRQNIYRAASFAWTYLMPRVKKCFVEFEIKKINDACAYCLKVDNHNFLIEIDRRLKGDDLMTAVFHEMVHVKQGFRKEWEFDEVSYSTHEEYINLPWEVEAYRMQEEMLDAWNIR